MCVRAQSAYTSVTSRCVLFERASSRLLLEAAAMGRCAAHSSRVDDGLPECMVVDPGQRSAVGLKRGAVCLMCWHGRPPPGKFACSDATAF